MMPTQKTAPTSTAKKRTPKEGALQAMASNEGITREASKTQTGKTSGLKPKAQKSTTSTRRTAKPKELPTPKKQASLQRAVLPTAGIELEADYPHQLKWQEAGISFELYSTDGDFMNRQAWRVQATVAGLVNNTVGEVAPAKKAARPAHKLTSQPKMYYVPQTLPDAPHEWLQQVQHALHASHHPTPDAFDTDEIQAWLNATEAKVAQLNLPKPKPKAPIQAPPEPQASMEHIVASTLKAFQQEAQDVQPMNTAVEAHVVKQEAYPAPVQSPVVEALPVKEVLEVNTFAADITPSLPVLEPSTQATAVEFETVLQEKTDALPLATPVLPEHVVDVAQANVSTLEPKAEPEPAPESAFKIEAEPKESIQELAESPSIFNTMLKGIHASMEQSNENKPQQASIATSASEKESSIPATKAKEAQTSYSTTHDEHILTRSNVSKQPLHTVFEHALNLSNNLSERVLLCGYLLAERFPNPAFSMAMLKSEAERLQAGSISYSALQQSLDQGYISVVPDLTGNADAMMYQVTSIGKRYAESLCK